MAAQAKPKRGFIDPARFYTYQAFKDTTGIDSTRIWRAKKAGIFLTTVNIGRRKFVRGEDAIAYLLALSTLGGEE